MSQSEPKVRNTKFVLGRRELRFESYDELLADAEKLAEGDVRTLGNLSFGQIMCHLARSIQVMIDGAPFSLPSPVQWLANLFMKRSFLKKTLEPGFNLPKKASELLPEEATVEEGLAELRSSIQRAKTETTRVRHPLLGKLTPEEHDQFNFRHAEMHMSFVLPSASE